MDKGINLVSMPLRGCVGDDISSSHDGMSKTVVTCTLSFFYSTCLVVVLFFVFVFNINGVVTSKVQNVVFYHNETVSLSPELCATVLLFLQAQSSLCL